MALATQVKTLRNDLRFPALFLIFNVAVLAKQTRTSKESFRCPHIEGQVHFLLGVITEGKSRQSMLDGYDNAYSAY